MTITSMRSTLLVALLLVAALPAYSQDNQNPPALPDIAPRVVEIRGQLEISMPSLQRQPLVGFYPPPSVAPIPPDRHPVVEDYKQESLDLPPSPLSPPEPPSVASLIGRAPRNGLLEADVGRYLTRGIRFNTEWPMSDRVAVYSQLDYEGTEGHEPDGGVADAKGSYDALDAMVGLQFVSNYAAVGVEVDGIVNSYRLFAAEPAASSGDLRDDPPQREGRGGGGSVWIRSQAPAAVDFESRVRLGTTTYETDALLDDAPDREDDFIREEQTLEAEADLDLPLAGRQSVRADAHVTALGADGASISSTASMYDGAGGMHFALGRVLEITALGRILGYAVAGTATSESEDAVYVSPDVSVDFYPLNGLRLYAENRPRSEHITMAGLLNTNPYVVDEPLVMPTVFTIDARGGGRVQVGVFEADLHAGYSRSPNFMFFESAETSEANGYVRGFFTPRYRRAEITYAGGDVSVNLPAGFNASAGLTVRDGSLTTIDEDIPYFGPVVGRGALSYSFADGRGYIQAATTYESARTVVQGSDRKIGDYFDLDLQASYDFSPSLGGVVRFENLSAGYLERWEHYDQAPFVLSAGLRATW